MRNFKAISWAGRLMSAACLLFVLAVTTSAYSIVMRGGKRIEIPAQFSVTDMTLTYEAGHGFWITLQMAAIDIPATERANNERPGSLLGRATKEVVPPRTSQRPTQAPNSKASRSLTNRELEPFRQERLETERGYDKRLRDQGLPPSAVMPAQAEADAARLRQGLASRRAEIEANERALQLQTQIAALSAQLNDLQSRSAQVSVSPETFTVFGGVPFFGGRSRVNHRLFQVPSGVPIGGAFGTFHVPLSGSSSFHGGRIIVAPGRHVGNRGGSRGGHRR